MVNQIRETYRTIREKGIHRNTPRVKWKSRSKYIS